MAGPEVIPVTSGPARLSTETMEQLLSLMKKNTYSSQKLPFSLFAQQSYRVETLNPLNYRGDKTK